jgi:hypothetical protein
MFRAASGVSRSEKTSAAAVERSAVLKVRIEARIESRKTCPSGGTAREDGRARVVPGVAEDGDGRGHDPELDCPLAEPARRRQPARAPRLGGEIGHRTSPW